MLRVLASHRRSRAWGGCGAFRVFIEERQKSSGAPEHRFMGVERVRLQGCTPLDEHTSYLSDANDAAVARATG